MTKAGDVLRCTGLARHREAHAVRPEMTQTRWQLFVHLNA